MLPRMACRSLFLSFTLLSLGLFAFPSAVRAVDSSRLLVDEGPFRLYLPGVLTAGAGNEINQAPTQPHTPTPADKAANQSRDVTLSWQGGDPDGDDVTYEIHFGTSNPPPLAVAGQSTTAYDPGALAAETTYYWQIVAYDERGLTTTGPVWRFTTATVAANRAPLTPTNPVPVDKATGQSANVNLAWTGGDPDGDAVTYTIYFGATTPPPQVATDQTTTTYDPGTLVEETIYYWKVVAVDGRGLSTVGPVWRFTTEDTFCGSVTEIPQIECEALVVLYNSTYDYRTGGWISDAGWGKTTTPCTWSGVMCGSGGVQALYLSENRLVGSLPPELGNLANLQELHLQSNQLSGGLPPELGNLASLELLDVSGNQLGGTIPAELGNLVNLQKLHLNGSQLSGSIPPQLGNLANLELLDLSLNQLSGSIPPELGNLANLMWLYLSLNQLSGSIPPQLGSLTNLQELYLAENQLTGSIPAQLGSLAYLRVLSLNVNQLSGSIPAELGNLASLGALNLYGNQLSGSVPPELGNLASLQGLYLHENQLSGSLPLSLTRLTSLSYFYFSDTQLCEPADAAFQAWLDGVPSVISTGMTCP